MRFTVAAFTALLGLAAANPVQMPRAVYERAVGVLSVPSTNGTCKDGPTKQYTVVQGDTLTSIATQFKSGICDIFRASIPLGVTDPNFILTGQTLNVPTCICTPDNTSCLTAKEGTRTCLPTGPATYTIVAGDTIFLIGSTTRFDLTIDSILGANPGLDPNTLDIGQVINLPVCK